MDRLIVPVNFDNDKELYDYVTTKRNKADFIRNCIRKEKMQEEVREDDKKDLEKIIEEVVRKCFKEYRPVLEEHEPSMETIKQVANFFEED